MRALRARHAWLGWLAFAGCAVDPLEPDPTPVDADGDGVTVQAGDCDDHDPLVAAGRPDEAGNLVDENCDGVDGVDGDGDGVASVASGGVDCDDAAPSVLGPGVPDVADDGVDANCDGTDGVDQDGDGSPDLASGGQDCDDSNADVRPGNPERCDGVDQNCASGSDDERGLLTIGDGTTFHDLDAALRRASHGDTIVVCPGAYTASVEIDDDVTITGLGAREDIVLDAHGAGPVVTVGSVRWRASHLTIQGGLGAEDVRGVRVGGGVLVVGDGAAIQLEDVVISGNAAEEGAGLYSAADATISVTDSLITRNLAQVGGGVQLYGGSFDAVRTTFVDNVALVRGVDLAADPIMGDAFTRAPEISFEDVEIGRHDVSLTDPEDAVVVTGGTFTAVGGRFAGVFGTPLVVMPPPGVTPSSQIHLQGTVFEDNAGGAVGGLLDGGASVVEMTDVVFRRNTGKIGAMKIQGDPSIARNATSASMSGVTVADNVGTIGAGGLLLIDVNLDVQDSTFSGNSSLAGNLDAAGAALTARRTDGGLTRATIAVRSCSFTGNHTNRDGGAVAVYGAFDLSLDHSNFDGNEAAQDGGALYFNGLGGASTLYTDYVTFTGQRAGRDGGAIATVGVAQQVSRVDFIDCVAGHDGGAVDAAPYLDAFRVTEGSVWLGDAWASDCSAGGAGGILHATTPSVTVVNLEATRLHASRGGAFAFDPYLRYGTWVGPIVDIQGVTTSETSAVRGGYLDAVGIDLSMVDDIVTDSSAEVGGGLYLEPAVDEGGQAKLYASADIDSSTFARCTATGNLDQTRGGAIAGVGTNMTMINVILEDNNAARGRGGALWLGPMRQLDGRIDVRSVIQVSDSIFQNNGATEGGALALDAGSGRVLRTRFEQNAASARGGSIAIFDGSDRPGFLPFALDDSQVNLGSAPLGGAIYATSVDLTLGDSSLTGNSATWGGAIALDAAFLTRLTMMGGHIEGNTASVRGGGIYAVAPVDPALGILDLSVVSFGATPGSNTPDDLTIEGAGSTMSLGGRASRVCIRLDASCL